MDQGRAHPCLAPMVADVRFIFVAEMADSGQHRIRSGLTQSAESRVADALTQLDQLFNIPLFPQASVQLAPWIAALAVIGILYGAMVSYAQRDVKKLVLTPRSATWASSCSAMFALNSQGIQGGILQMVNHGLSTGALFLVVGMIYERRHTREMDAFGGLWKVMPIYAVLTLIVALSSMGLPGLNGFVAELTIQLGAWDAGQAGADLNIYCFAALAAIGVIVAAVYILFMFQKLFLGPVDKEENRSLPLPAGARIPLLTLQPLLENAIYHGVQPRADGGIVAVRIWTEGDEIRILITNPLPPAGIRSGSEGNRMALDNIRDRLEVLYGDSASLATVAEGESFRTEVRFPATGRGPL